MEKKPNQTKLKPRTISKSNFETQKKKKKNQQFYRTKVMILQPISLEIDDFIRLYTDIADDSRKRSIMAISSATTHIYTK